MEKAWDAEAQGKRERRSKLAAGSLRQARPVRVTKASPQILYICTASKRTFMDRAYFVTLNGVDSMPPAERITVEVRFAKELERGLGGPAEVVKTYQAWLDASESDAANSARTRLSKL